MRRELNQHCIFVCGIRIPFIGSLRTQTWIWLLSLLTLCHGLTAANAQSFKISSIAVSNGAVQLTFPSLANSYYLLQSSASLTKTPTPVAAQLGNGELQILQGAASNTSTYYRIEQIPINSTNSLLGDGIADGFKLENGLNPFGPSVANQIAPGYDITWLQVYQYQGSLTALPLAYFPTNTSTVLIGSSKATIQVAFTKPYTGYLDYQLTGTAIPSSSGVAGDYVQPSGSVYVPHATSATISIQLESEPDIEVNRSIIVALSAPAVGDGGYIITTNSSVGTIQIVQSTQGVYSGSLAITNGLFASAQSVKMAIRPGTNSDTVAFFDVTGNAFLGNTFTVPVTTNNLGFQLQGAQFLNVVSNTPWGRNVSLNLVFGSTQITNGAFSTPVTMSLGNLTASGVSYSGSGVLTVAQSQ